MRMATVGQAARETGWSPRMLRYLERAGLVVPRRTGSGYRTYGLLELNQLRSLQELRRRFRVELARALVRRAPAARARPASGSRFVARGHRAERARLGAAQARAAAGRLNRDTKERHGYDDSARRQGSRARAGRRQPDRVGRPADAGPGRDPRALRDRPAARGLPRLRVPARHERDRQPDAHAEGRRRGRRALRVEPAFDAGRRRGGARRRVRDLRLRDQGRGQRHLLPAHRGRGRPQAAADDGRRRRRDRRAPLAPARAARRHRRRDRGDDDRRDPAQGPRARRRARLPGDRGQRRAHQAHVRQPLRHGAVDDRRDRARDEHPARRAHVRRRRLRLVRPRRGDAREGHGRPRGRHRGRPAARARGRDGRLPGAADGAGGARSATSS